MDFAYFCGKYILKSTVMKTTRIATIDVFRAITMFLMLFVNDIPGLKQIPHWMLHADMNEDMLGFSDIIFPCFLFVMGMSVPFAILKREEKGEAIGNTLWHIVERTLALIVMGLFTVNMGSFDSDATGLPYGWYVILWVISVFLIWNLYPHALGLGIKIPYQQQVASYAAWRLRGSVQGYERLPRYRSFVGSSFARVRS